MNVKWTPHRVSAFADEIGDELELQLEHAADSLKRVLAGLGGGNA